VCWRTSRGRGREAGRGNDVVGNGVSIPRWPSLEGHFNEKESPIGGARGESLGPDFRDEPQGPRSVSSRIVSSEVFTLELENVSNQQLSVLPRHFDKPGMMPFGVGWVGVGVDPQHFDRRCKTHLFSK
jgi:hypothetical protein